MQAATAAAQSLTVSSATLTVTIPTVPVKAPAAPVTVPTVPVKAPAVPVKAPAVPVKVPAVKVPAVPVKVPAVPVKVPSVPVKVPAVTVKTPSVKTTTDGKSPSVSVKAPSVSVKTPTVGAKTLAGSVKAPSLPGTPLRAGSRAPSTGTTGTSGSRSSSDAGGPLPSASGSLNAISALWGSAPGALATNARAGAGGRLKGAAAVRAARERALKALVTELRGCLGALPERSRLALELRTGLAGPQALSPRSAAKRLHMRIARFSRLEHRAIRELRTTASTHGCEVAPQVVGGIVGFLEAAFGGGAQATGGVEAVRYSAKPGSKLSPPVAMPATATHGSVLGDRISPAASDAILALIALLIAAVTVGAVVADSAGHGPRHPQWRKRVTDRLPWRR